MQKSARETRFVIRNGRPSDVGPEAYGSNFGDLPKLLHKHLLVLRVCKLARLSRPDHRV